MNVQQSKVGYGSLGLQGDLGYSDTMTGDKVMLPPRIRYERVLSAHAPSEITVELPGPNSVRGALNASASLTDGSVCEFWIDNHWIGDLTSPCRTTPAINLPAGTYRLRVKIESSNYGAHSVWLLSDDKSNSPRVALVTVGCYPESEVKLNLRWLFLSAAKCGWLVHAFGAGMEFNFYRSKVESLVDWLKALPKCYEYVVFTDARDTFIFGTEQEFLPRLVGPVVISTESCTWPENSVTWTEELKKIKTQYNEYDPSIVSPYINSGMFAGKRDLVVACLQGICKLRSDWLAGNCPVWLKPYRYFDNDQFLWQAYYRFDPSIIKLDTREELLCTMTSQHLELIHKDIHPGDRKVTTRYNTEPLLFHFNCYGVSKLPCWFYWLFGSD